jgi:hypothetical protein
MQQCQAAQQKKQLSDAQHHEAQEREQLRRKSSCEHLINRSSSKQLGIYEQRSIFSVVGS